MCPCVCVCSGVSVMAVSIMSACCRASLLSLYFLACFLQVLIQGEVFRAGQTQDVFLRSKRANSFLLEELLQGNLERECYEEACSYEEAREYFENTPKTNAFWTRYVDGDQCESAPCLHGGNCSDRVGGFLCSCPAPHHGPVCQLGGAEKPATARQTTTAELVKCPTEGPTACHQLCTASQRSFTCSCMPGFKLQRDGQSCLPEVAFPCGRLPDKFHTTESICRHGNCPWQVSLFSSRGVELCGGVVLGRRSVLTAARCLFPDSQPDLRPSNFAVGIGANKKVPVQALYVHESFRRDHQDNNLAILELSRPLNFSPALIHLCLPEKDFSENILMHAGKTGVAAQRGGRRTQTLVHVTPDECRGRVNASHRLSNKMFCMARQNGAARSPNGPLRPQNRAERSLDGFSGNENGTESMLNGHLGPQNVTQRSPNVPLRHQNGAQRSPNVPLRHQNVTQRSLNGPLRHQNGAQRSLNGPLRHQNGAQRSLNGPLRHQNVTQRSLNGPLRHQNVSQRSPNVPLRHQNGAQRSPNVPLRHQNVTQRSLNGPLRHQNVTQRSPNVPLRHQNGAQRSLNGPLRHQTGAQRSLSSAGKRSKIENPETLEPAQGSGRCGELLPGTPVATVERGTAFLTGLLMTSSSGCGGGGDSDLLVFTKLSRYLSWIRPRLKVAEDYVTPQQLQYPEER
ncbi:protein Z, vitamin K-dependent plasma glycoprotein b isoform X2 [Sander lucioperca]|uniref:protein Z, vitamin K-dependent plasma glycoprotein b isoform X2 n=1 Tax=Sander lucioperca TaxID=283035 RepID=UPI00125CE593|nr:protein Z, vitamin K-dependent plasma glycoprotein b isoform X2 [Sander lucioperca]